ncbi:MAG: NAD(P)/FAD-dependent oxidoreductase [Burkholderiales bacterium]|jgi:D-amino-acid dehydrogenase
MSKHVLIVGGGIVGLSVAYYCARKGHRVTLIERGGPDRDGCSFANAGMVVPSHFVPLASPGVVRLGLRSMWNAESAISVKPRFSADLVDWGWKFYRAATKSHVDQTAPRLRDLHLASRECYRQWIALWGNDFGLAERGLLVLCNTELGLEEEAKTAEHARALGMPAQLLTAAATAELEPNMRMAIAGSIYFPMDCHLVPGRLMAALSHQAEEAGVRAHYCTSVTGWRSHGNRVAAVQTSGETFIADEFVVCAGIWSKDIARDLGIKLPMQAGKGYSLTVETRAPQPRVCAILSEARVAMTPMGSALRFGGTMELAGIDEGINPIRVRGIVKSIARYYPDFMPSQFEGAQVRSGLRPCSPDGLPYVGRFARFANLSTATGHAMMGVSLGPITGKLMAEILSDEPPSCSMEGLSPDRYA